MITSLATAEQAHMTYGKHTIKISLTRRQNNTPCTAVQTDGYLVVVFFTTSLQATHRDLRALIFVFFLDGWMEGDPDCYY